MNIVIKLLEDRIKEIRSTPIDDPVGADFVKEDLARVELAQLETAIRVLKDSPPVPQHANSKINRYVVDGCTHVEGTSAELDSNDSLTIYKEGDMVAHFRAYAFWLKLD